jgi:hypothetical protein
VSAQLLEGEGNGVDALVENYPDGTWAIQLVGDGRPGREARPVSAPLRGLLPPLSPLEQIVEEFVVTAAVPCWNCQVSGGNSCDGPVCRPRRSAAWSGT